MTEKNKKMNILLCFDDKDGNYTRHAAVTILSLLETNKKNKIKIYIMTSGLPQENIDELKRIVNSYNQEIEFIISDDIVPEELKKVIINKRENMRGPWYRYFFPKFIKGIDRILYMDCDVLVMKDISDIYNIDMSGKAIGGYYDIRPDGEKNRKKFHLRQYINSGVLLFDVKKYAVEKINAKKMNEINKKFSKYFRGWDQDKTNIIFEEDIFIINELFNYQISNKWFNKGLENATIVHCLQKPWVEGSCISNSFRDIYERYQNLTKWKGIPEKKANYGYLHHMYNMIYHFLFNGIWILIGKMSGKYHH